MKPSIIRAKFTRAKTLGYFYESQQIKRRIKSYKYQMSHRPTASKTLNEMNASNSTLAVFNFSDKETEYTMSLGDIKELSLIIDTDDQRFGGRGVPDKAVSVKNGKAVVLLSPFSGRVYAVKSL